VLLCYHREKVFNIKYIYILFYILHISKRIKQTKNGKKNEKDVTLVNPPVPDYSLFIQLI
jgi:hypothetical protein